MKDIFGNGKRLKWLIQQHAEDTDGCIVWPFSKDRYGYGLLTGGTFKRAHSEMCFRTHGPKPFPEACAIHRCGVRACINKHHIRWGTPKENGNERVNNLLIEFEGTTRTLQQWSEQYGLSPEALAYRLKRWDVRSAFLTKVSYANKYLP
jgi:hypothetical protein